uniref:Chitin-binding type-2 domain-containing protein n=1 Tax=Anopheles christyi TaxID=43041 RepID=A0A182K0H9_9DIPT
MDQLYAFYVLSVVLHLYLAGAQQAAVQEEGCPKATRPHMTRCDQYYRCTVLSKDAHVWVATQCQKGLVYLHNLGTCVVPDNDWECDISAENQRSHSEENVYGIDNLNIPSLPSTGNSASEERSEETQTSTASKEDHTKANGSYQLDQNDLESSGDGSSERVGDDIHTSTPLTITTTGTKAPTRVSTSSEKSKGNLNTSQLDSFLAYYDTQNAFKLKTNPPKMNEQNYLTHLKKIVSQQKQLNEMAQITSRENLFSYKPVVPVQQLSKKKEPETDDSLSKINLSPGMQDIIKSILDISQKAIANQKQPPASPAATSPIAKDPVVKPIFIPISVNPVPVPSVPQPSPTTTEQPAKVNYPSNYNPTSFSFSNLGYGAIQNSLRIFDSNDTMYHNFPQQQVLYDAYGNRFVPKDAYQQVPTSYPSPSYSSPLNPTVQQSSSMLLNDSPTGYSYYSSNTRPSLRIQPSRFNEPLTYFQRFRPSFQRINPPASDYDGVGDDVIDSGSKPLGSIESIELTDANGSLEKDLHLPVSRQEDDSNDESSQEDGHGNSAELKYKRKLFTLGDTTFDYEQYKDSMLPLVDANPDDERISVVLCMVGSRQPNNTDCFRYYICNPHNGVFQSYTCPPQTAFNKKSRMCDLTSYKQCKALMAPPPPARPLLRTHKQPAPNQRTTQVDQIKHELRKAQKYVEMIRLEANRVHLRNGTPSNKSDQKVIFLPSLADRRPTASSHHTAVQRKEANSKKKASIAKQPARKVPRCKLEGRMPDPMDQSNYYVCHRKSPNKFIKLKMACPVDLLYCADTQYCTLRSNC